MDWSRAPLLFMASQPPLPLSAERVVVLGRSQGCDLPVPSPEASRRHAEVLCRDGAWWVRDLGSTNGTQVNGEAVAGERALRPGDRIEIGACTITFCLLESRAGSPVPGDPSGEAQTRLWAPRQEAEALRGELSEVPSFAVLQILEMGRKTGVLEIASERVEGRLWLAEGAPVHAEAKGVLGFDAAVALVNATSGRFSFEASATTPEHTIRCSATQLLLEASRLLDEERRGGDAFGDGANG